ncbi:response regulator [Halovenus sp. WSH3]|uniref:Response regulator n=1 Tax=Halovenus carboxidivorans TaxID=2692199 RepID=A0A6B0T5P5_9EURY|nr:response regulator [Halovenus carboxidivorans]MXR52257.1 response regulator [Halovenus carboxidivorans]
MESLDVLIVDDTDGCRDLYAFWLEDDHAVETAPNGTVALDRIDHSVDLVLMDRNMPGPSGLDVAAEMRTAGYDCPIVMISSEPADVCLSESPLDEYLRKPVDESTLESTIEDVTTRPRLDTAKRSIHQSS